MGCKGGALWRSISFQLPEPTMHPEERHRIAALQESKRSDDDPNTAQTTANGTCHASSKGRTDSQVPASGHEDGGSVSQADGHVVQGLLPLRHVPVACAGSSDDVAGTITVTDGSGNTATANIRFFSYLRQLLSSHHLDFTTDVSDQLPFNFWGGLVGYLGYELKAECGGDNAHTSPMPDASFMFADRLVALDNQTGDIYILAVYEKESPTTPDATVSATKAAADEWIQTTQKQIQSCLASSDTAAVAAVNGTAAAPKAHENGANGVHVHAHVNGHVSEKKQQQPAFRLKHNKQRYLDNISGCIRCLYSGDSYEVCLTTALARRGAPHPETLYRTLRSINPAPYGAWLNFGAAGPVMCCSSPERFLRGDRGGVLEARPIKGTAARHLGKPKEDAAAAAALAASEKDRAENLMIVDLLRNDLGHVCEVGSVHVPGLMEIESYATVHQMVSTVRGLRRKDVSLVDAIQAAFPAGSMTGAPKVRTMQIIDQLEGCARGVYSGCIGFISLNDCFDLNVVIRTAAIYPTPGKGTENASITPGNADGVGPNWDDHVISIGAGGAIVVQSELESEYDEMKLKARALLASVGRCDSSDGPAQLDAEGTWLDGQC